MIPAHAPAPLTATRTSRNTIQGLALVASACCLVLAPGQGAQKKTKPKKEEITQVLQLPKELPGAVTGETRRLTFHVTPLSSHGLLSAQVRDAPRALTPETGRNPRLNIPPFAAARAQLDPIRRPAARRRAGGPGGHCRRKKGGEPAWLGLLVRPRRHQRQSARPRRTARRAIARPLEARPQNRRFRVLRCRARHLLPQFPGESRRHPETGGSRLSPGRDRLPANPALPLARSRRLRSRRATPLEHRQTRLLPAGERRAPGRVGRRPACRAHRHAGQLWQIGRA